MDEEDFSEGRSSVKFELTVSPPTVKMRTTVSTMPEGTKSSVGLHLSGFPQVFDRLSMLDQLQVVEAFVDLFTDKALIEEGSEK